MSHRKLSTNSNLAHIPGVIASRNSNETFKYCYNLGLSFHYNAKKRFGIVSGIVFTNTGFVMKEVYIRTLVPQEMDLGLAKVDFNFHTLDLPFRMNKIVGRKKV